ncbi:MAG: cytochrome P450 [Aquabacterium sp.]|jgi:cytochrome P450|nr:MAG: cytochrome P450 [Aquabacterium sp.]
MHTDTTASADEAPAAVRPPRRIEDLPSPRALPVLGNLLQIDPPRLHLLAEQWARELGTPFRIIVPGPPIVAYTDIELMHTVLRERPERYRRTTNVEAVLAEMGANGVFSAEGEAWKPQRRLVMQALAATNFRGFHPQLAAITERLLRRWQRAAQRGEIVEMTHELVRYTVDVTCALAFGEDPNTLEQGEDVIQKHLAHIFPMIMARITKPFPYWHYVKLPRDRKLDEALKVVHAYVRDLMERARKRMRDEPAEAPRNLLEGMLRVRDEAASGLTDDDVAANVLTLLLAGEDTTAHTLAWTLYFLAPDKQLQARAHEEAKALLGEHAVLQDYDALKKLDFFEALSTEATRLKPIAPLNSVEPLQDVVLDGVALPKGTRVFFINRPAMLDPKNFADPLSYCPQRWQRFQAEPITPHEPRAYLQFGTGPRVCPGRFLAGTEIRHVLAMLMRNFEIDLAVDPSEIREVLAFAMTPSRMPVRLKAR